MPTKKPSRQPSQVEQDIGKHLARIRKKKGFTQRQLADMLGLPQSYVSGYERAAIRLHGGVIVKLTRILGVSADELLGLRGGKTSNGTDEAARVRRFSRRLPQIERLSRRDQDALLHTIDKYLSQAAPRKRRKPSERTG